MIDWLTDNGLKEFFTAERLSSLLRVAAVLVLGLLFARLAASAVGRTVAKRSGPQETMIAKRVTFYGLLILVVASALHELGFHLGVFLGAAGVLTVALGFASQTSASNIISGLFLLAERAFVVGDLITVDGLTGEVLSVDLLSVKIRTFDNLYVRVPNENIIKTRVTNLTRFPIRRVDVQVGVAYKEDLERVRGILFDVAHRSPTSLDEPEPLFIIKGFGESGIDIQFSVWAERRRYLDLKNEIQRDIKVAFDAAGVEIPFPHRTLYTGSVTSPWPVRVVDPKDDQPS